MMRRLAILLSILWVLTRVGTAANFDESPPFELNTLTPGGTGSAVSLPFVLNTLTPGATGVAVSGTFTVNTRGPTGLSGIRVSGGFVVDTRNVAATELMVVAPPTVSGGIAIDLSATATFSSGLTEDVTDRAAWSVTGGPLNTRMNGRTLTTGHSAVPVTAYVRASYFRNGRQIVSLPRAIVIAPALKVALSAVPPVGFGGIGPLSWTLRATATPIGGVGPFMVQWRWRGETLDDQTTLSLVKSVGGALGLGQLDVTVTDAQGRTGHAFTLLALNKAPVPTQPVRPITVKDHRPGLPLHSGGVTGVNLLEARKNAGLLVVVHGLKAKVERLNEGGPCADWMVRLAQAVEAKLESAPDGPPNVLLYDWEKSADPSADRGTDAYNEAIVDFLTEVGIGTVAIQPSVGAGTLGSTAVLDLAVYPAFETLVDISYIRPAAERHGEALAEWIEQQISMGKIAVDAPIHFVGHSAGGFVAAQCASRLLAPRTPARTFADLLVTTLDTPMVRRQHILGVKERGGRIERYTSSILGEYVNPGVATLPDHRTVYPVLFSDTAQTTQTAILKSLPTIISDPGYRIGSATATGRCTGLFASHSEAHQWYLDTVPAAETEKDGFYFSPFLGHRWSSGGTVVSAAPPLAFAAPPPPADLPLGGFQTFGQVLENAGEFTITELDDAGIFHTMTIPIGATDLKFRVRFDQIGDGDFLEVSFADRAPLALIDAAASRMGQWLEYEVSTRAIAGENGTLLFRLVSRGAGNAVVRLDSLAFVMSDDPDGDALSNSEEASLGSDPLIFDSDGDGLSDGFEAHTSHTDFTRYDSDGDGVDDARELLAGTNTVGSASVFSVKHLAQNADGSVSLWWTGRGGSTYRVLRSATPEFTSFDVVAAAVPGVAPLTTFTDATVDARQLAGAFYRVEVAEAAAYAANMNADSDGDGIPDGWELDRGFNADSAADALLDTDSDGNNTLLEFALGTDPRVNSPDGIGIYTDEDGYLTLTSNRNPAATGLQLRIAVSGDLAAWHSDAAHVTILANTTTLLKARDNIPLGSAPHRFIRLEVSK